MTPLVAYYEFLQQLRVNTINELDFDFNKDDRSICRRRRDFNTLYEKYCEEEFGGENGERMLDQIEKQINGYTNMIPDLKIVYQLLYPDIHVRYLNNCYSDSYTENP